MNQMQSRAYSLLEVKSIDQEQRVIKGIASTPTPDRMGDIVEPMGAQFKTPMPLLWQHDHSKPVGHVTFAQPNEKGIPFEAKLATVDEPGTLKDRIDEAWQSVKSGLVSAVSIGFRSVPGAVKQLKNGGLHFQKWDWMELSLVTIPANSEATISTVKSLDAELRAANGNESSAKETDRTSAGVSAPVVTLKYAKQPKEGNAMKLAQQITGFEEKRLSLQTTMEELMEKAGEEGRTLDAEETQAYDDAEAEIQSVDKHLKRLRALEAVQATKAKAPEIKAAKDPHVAEFVGVSANQITHIKREVPKGTAFTRYAMSLAKAKGNLMQAAEYAKHFEDSTPEVGRILKAAVDAGTTTDAEWAGNLVDYTNMASEFIELLRPATIIGQIQGLRRVPFNVRLPGQTGGSSVNWVGEGAPKPVSALAFDTTTLRFNKVAGIVVLTDELVRFSNPSAEAIVRQDLVATTAQFLDEQFLDPDKAAVDGVSPASILNGLTAITPSGTDADALRADVRSLFANFISSNQNLNSAVFIMSSSQALAISMITNVLGQAEFPTLTMNGGSLLGVQVIVSETAGDKIVLAKASEILLADDGGVTLDASREASLQLDSAPSAGAQQLVSLWQNNMVALRVERFITWQRRRPEAVTYIAGAAYGSEIAST